MEKMKKHQDSVQALSSKDPEVIIRAVDTLSAMSEDPVIETDLINLVARGCAEETDLDDYTPFWAMIILGHLGSQASIPALLEMLDTGWDIWMEAATEALESIARRHGDAIFPELEAYVISRMNNDPACGRLYVYSAIAAITESDLAKQFLIQQYEQDDKWSDAIAGDLVVFKDPKLLPVLRRGIERARAFDEIHAEIESLEAYCLIDGMPAISNSLSKKKESWQQRWNSMLKKLSGSSSDDSSEQSKLTDEDAKEMIESLQSLLESDGLFLEKMKQRTAQRDAWPLRNFCLKDYLNIRPRSDFEQQMEDVLVLLGMSKSWTVEKIQTLINASQKPSDVLTLLLDHFEFPTQEAFESFSGLFMALWNKTPREEFQGLSPSEKREAAESVEGRLLMSKKNSRNDPCPCGAIKENGQPKKFKKCHGA